MPIFNNQLAGAAGQSGADAAYQIDRSVRINASDSAYFSRNPSSAGNRKKWTWSSWIKRNELGRVQRIWNTVGGASNDENWFAIFFNASDQIVLGGYTTLFRTTSAVYRDCSAWLHLVVHVDLDASTTMKVWVNGAEQTLTGTSNPSQTAINSTLTHQIGRETNNNSACSLQLADVHFIDGQALTADDFGEPDDNGVWQPKEFAGNYSLSYTNNVTATGTGGVSGISSTYPLSNLFDQNLTNVTATNAANISSTAAVLTLTFPTGFQPSYNSSVVLEPYAGSSDTVQVSINGGAYQTVTGTNNYVQHTVASGSGTITEIKVSRQKSNTNPGAAELRQIIIDGSPLLDFGTNSFRLDFSDNSSNAALGDDSSGNNNDWTVNNIIADSLYSNAGFLNPENAFDGNTSTSAEVNVTGGLGTFLFTQGISVSSTITVKYASGTSGNIFINGSSTAMQGTGTQTQTINFTGTLNSLGLQSGSGPVLYYIQIDGGSYLTGANAVDNDSLIDTPTNYESENGNAGGNYATWNPIDHRNLTNGPTYTLSNGNLDCDIAGGTTNSSENRGLCTSTIELQSGVKWYCEIKRVDFTNNDFAIGIASSIVKGYYSTGAKPGAYMLRPDGQFYHPTGKLSADSSRTYANGDIIGIAVDLQSSTKTIVFYKNGSSIFSYTVDESQGPFRIAAGTDAGSGNSYAIEANFGQRPFAYTAPSGYKALCTTNLTDPTIADGSTAMDVVKYDGNGTNINTISGLSMSPDLVWLKRRDSASHHALYDRVRGEYKHIGTSHTSGEFTESTGRGLSAFNSDGFTIDTSNGEHVGNGSVNVNNATYAAWTWGGGSYPTNSSYNQTAKWSDDASGTLRSVAGNTHLGAFSGLENYNNTKEWTQIAGDNTWTFAPSGGISNVQGLKVLVFPRLGTLTLNVNGSQVTTNTGNSLNTVDLSSAFSTPGTLNNITITSSGSGSYWGIISVQVDTGSGYKILADPGVDTNGSIASITLANPSAGFSIVTYTATGSVESVGHGLNDVPALTILKNRDASGNWLVYTQAIDGSLDYLNLNTTGAKNDSGNSAPTSSVVYLGGTNNQDYIAYCFAPVAGYSSFGSYTGNGSSTDGTFVFTGMRPRWIMIKNSGRSGGSQGWYIYDSERDEINVANTFQVADQSYGEQVTSNNVSLTSLKIDILSNGFKHYNDSYALNFSGDTYIYACFAESPFKYSRAR